MRHYNEEDEKKDLILREEGADELIPIKCSLSSEYYCFALKSKIEFGSDNLAIVEIITVPRNEYKSRILTNSMFYIPTSVGVINRLYQEAFTPEQDPKGYLSFRTSKNITRLSDNNFITGRSGLILGCDFMHIKVSDESVQYVNTLDSELSKTNVDNVYITSKNNIFFNVSKNRLYNLKEGRFLDAVVNYHTNIGNFYQEEIDGNKVMVSKVIDEIPASSVILRGILEQNFTLKLHYFIDSNGQIVSQIYCENNKRFYDKEDFNLEDTIFEINRELMDQRIRENEIISRNLNGLHNTIKGREKIKVTIA